MKKSGKVGILFSLLMTGVVLPLFAAEQSAQVVSTTVKQAGIIKGILQPTTNSLSQVSAYLPKLGVLLLILVIGALVAVGVVALVTAILKLIQLEKGAKKINVPEILKKGGIGISLSELITEIIFFIFIIATLITALEFYGVGTAVLTGSILAYIPQVIAAMFILILGILVAILISGIIKLVGGNVKIAQSDTLGNVAKYAIIILSTVIALKELGLGIILTDKSKDIIFAGVVLSLALGFGLGLKGKAEDFLGKIFKK
jgi:type III secretory pathway component EscU